MAKMVMRAFLEFKNGMFRGVDEVLAQPGTWADLTPECRRLVKRYAAKLGNAAVKFEQVRGRRPEKP